jgi:hypothetical protein
VRVIARFRQLKTLSQTMIIRKHNFCCNLEDLDGRLACLVVRQPARVPSLKEIAHEEGNFSDHGPSARPTSPTHLNFDAVFYFGEKKGSW